jgi:hypothetical protein
MSLLIKTYIEYDCFVPASEFCGGQSCWDLSFDYFMSETFSPLFLVEVMRFSEKKRSFDTDVSRNEPLVPFGPLRSAIDEEMFTERRVGWIIGSQFDERISTIESGDLFTGDKILIGIITSLFSSIPKENIRIVMVVY